MSSKKSSDIKKELKCIDNKCGHVDEKKSCSRLFAYVKSKKLVRVMENM